MTEQINKLGEFFDTAEASHLDALGVFPADPLDSSVCGRILSSAERKAGINMNDMKENITVNRTKKHGKRFVGFVIAAAVLSTGAIGAGAYAYTQFINRQNVDHYLGEGAADKLENLGLVLNNVQENEHIRLTADTALSDGTNACIVFKLEKLDERSRELLWEYHWTCDFYYADTGEPCNFGSLGAGGSDWNYGEYTSTKKYIIGIGEADISRPIKAENFFLYVPQTGEEIESDLLDGFEFEFDLTKNVETTVLTAASGNELTMSQFAIWGSVDRYPEFFDLSSEEIAALEDYSEYPRLGEISMIRADGTRQQLSDEDRQGFGSGTVLGCGKNDDGSNFFKLITGVYDLDDYIGVEICGVDYLKQ